MKKNIDQSLSKEIEELAQNLVPQILYHYKLSGEKITKGCNWYTSESYLKQVNYGDIAIADFTNMFDFSTLGFTNKFTHLIQELYPNNAIKPSGFYLYPKSGFMSWHTNSNMPCKRVYITYADQGNESFFRYWDGANIITDYDNGGITIREFDIPTLPNKFWHCVGSNCNRFSFGFKIL